MNSIAQFFKELTLGKKLFLILTPVISTLTSMKAIILGLWILILLDLLTGIRKNLHMRGIGFNPFKKNFWLSIKSYLLRQTWKKTYEYSIGIVAVMVLEQLIFGGIPISFMGRVFSISEISVLLPATVELWSIFENLEAVSGNNILKNMKHLLPDSLKKLIDKITNKKEEDE